MSDLNATPTRIDVDRLASRIQAERLNRGWTMSELVRRTGINRGTLYRLERGDSARPQMKTVRALAEAFGVTPESLLGLHPPGEPRSVTTRSLTVEQRFDRTTNPLVSEIIDERPGLFECWTESDVDELYSLFGTGGQLTRSGVVEAAEAINRKRETIRKLHVVLETGLRDQAVDLIDALYRIVRVAPRSADFESVHEPGSDESPSE